MVRLGQINPIVYDEAVEEVLTSSFEERKQFHEEDILSDWRVDAASKRLDREMFEQYWYFKDIVLHPTVQHYKQYLDHHVSFDLQLGEPLLPLTTCVILLYMLSGRVGWIITMFVAALLFNINPLYVVPTIVVLGVLLSKKSIPKQFVPVSVRNVPATAPHSHSLHKPRSLEYDHVLIGNDLGTMFTASMLSSVGHRCCVLEPSNVEPLVYRSKDVPCEVPLVSMAFEQIDKYQVMLDTVQGTDKNKRVCFAPIGSADNGFATHVIQTSSSTFVIGAGSENCLASCLSDELKEDKAVFTSMANTLAHAHANLVPFLQSRVVSPSGWSVAAGEEGAKKFVGVAVTSLKELLKMQEVSPAAQDMLEAVCQAVAGSALTLEDLSAAVLADAFVGSEFGLFYPHGGPGALYARLAEVVVSKGGDVVREVVVAGLEVDGEGGQSMSVSGVKITSSDGSSASEETIVTALRSVVSGLGCYATLQSLIPSTCLAPPQTADLLTSLSVEAPKLKALYWIDSNDNENFGLSSSDFIICPRRASPPPPPPVSVDVQCVDDIFDNMDDSAIESVSKGVESEATLANDSELGNEESNQSRAEVDSSDDLIIECPRTATNLSCVSDNGWGRVWCPSAKDPLWRTTNAGVECVVVELECSDSFKSAVSAEEKSKGDWGCLGRSVKLTNEQIEEVQRKADAIVFALYPKIRDGVTHRRVVSPNITCLPLAPTPAKFSNPVNAVTHVQGLFLCGSDVGGVGSAGTLQGAWVAAHAVLGWYLFAFLRFNCCYQVILRKKSS